MHILVQFLLLQLAIATHATVHSDSDTCKFFDARVVRIVDGDTFYAVTKDSTVRIRLYGIDAPEYGQDFYGESKQLLSDLSYHQFVRIEDKGFDRYGRTLGIIIRKSDELNINREMVKEGLAWNYVRYSTDEEMPKLESDARKKQIGIWSHFNYLEPWIYRRIQ